MASKKKLVKRRPKSQTEIAQERKSKALERAGDAVIKGDKKKAAKILTPKTPKKSKKEKEASAAALVAELRVKERSIRMLDLEIETLKHKFAETKKRREKINAELLQELGESNQGRLPFDEQPPRPTKDVDAAVNAANSDAPPATSPDATAPSGPTQAELEDAGKELDNMTKSPGDSIEGETSDGLPAPAKRAPRLKGKRAQTVTHEAVGAA